MCGRFSFAVNEKIIEEHYGFLPQEYKPRYNCAPGQTLAVITNIGNPAFNYYRWGLIPFWAQNASLGQKLINAKAETLTEKPAFKYSFSYQRCLIPADSFYEWSQDKMKTPYRIFIKNFPVFSMAGIWSEWKNENNMIYSFAVITTEANEFIKPIHHRMPVIFTNKDEETKWFSGDVGDALFLLKNSRFLPLEFYPVSKLINVAGNDSEALHKQVSEDGKLF